MYLSNAITPDDLKSIASRAVTEFLSGNGPLTQTVVKEASASALPLTSEHVRRICEMTYHDAFERMHRASDREDRYVSFDPPNAAEAIQMLRAEKVANAPSDFPVARTSPEVSMNKAASASKRYTPKNAFLELVKSAEARDVVLADPDKGMRDALFATKEAAATVGAELRGLRSRNTHETYTLLNMVKAAATQENLDAATVLSAAVSNVPEGVASDVVFSVINDTTAYLASKGIRTDKVASTIPAVNPNHPLPTQFNKVAELRQRILEHEQAFEDLTKAVRGVSKEAFVGSSVKAVGSALQALGPRGAAATAAGTGVSAPTAAQDVTKTFDKLRASRKGVIL